MIVGLALIAIGAATLGGLLAYAMGANILLFTLIAGYGAPMLMVAVMVLRTWRGLVPHRIASEADDLAARP